MINASQRKILASFLDGPRVWDAAPLFRIVCDLSDLGLVKFVEDGPLAEITDKGRKALR